MGVPDFLYYDIRIRDLDLAECVYVGVWVVWCDVVRGICSSHIIFFSGTKLNSNTSDPTKVFFLCVALTGPTSVAMNRLHPCSRWSLFCEALKAVSLKVSLRYVNGFDGTLSMSPSEKFNFFLTCSRS